MGKTASKSAKRAKPSPKNGNQLPLGAHPGNTGGKKGRSGRKPYAWRAFCHRAITDPDTQDVILTALRDPSTPGWNSLVRTVAEYAVGVPEPVSLTPEERRQRVMELLGVHG